jgi:hypothetical protein
MVLTSAPLLLLTINISPDVVAETLLYIDPKGPNVIIVIAAITKKIAGTKLHS